jgi:hypothetical protein
MLVVDRRDDALGRKLAQRLERKDDVRIRIRLGMIVVMMNDAHRRDVGIPGITRYVVSPGSSPGNGS